MHNHLNGQYAILRRREVEKMTGMSRSTIYLHMSLGEFPKPIKLGSRSVGWIKNEILSWLESKIQERDLEV
ncbi:MAG: AlpA family transcriptional regulator [Denitrovibrio sp.]|nr:MAG: AlpA family transcriptional regulator [Denitrovibrio sp.]